MKDPRFDNPDRCILDLRGLVLHAYYSNKPGRATVRGSTGKDVPASEHGVSAFLDIYLNPILKRWAPVDIIVVGEGKDGNARRRAMHADYKNRPEQDADDAVAKQQKADCLKGVSRILMHLGCPLVNTPYCEADDTIAFLVDRLKGEKTVYTKDKDLLALADRATLMIPDHATGEIRRVTKFEHREIRPDLLIANPEDFQAIDSVPGWYVTLFKSIAGDRSDNYGGVKGMGPKAFHDLVHEVGLDGCEQLVEIVSKRDWAWLQSAAEGSKLLTKLNSQRDEWSKGWELAKLRPEWCEQNWRGSYVRPQWTKRVPQRENLHKELRIHYQEDRIDDYEHLVVRQWLMDQDWLNTSQASLETELHAMSESSFLAFDYESYDTLKYEGFQKAKPGFVDVNSQDVTGASFCYGSNLNRCFYIPINHRDTANCEKGDIVELLQHVRDKNLVAQNASFELVVSKNSLGYEFDVDNIPHDTAITMSYVDEEEEAGLKKMSKAMLNYDQINYSQVVGPDQDMRDISGAEVLKYGCDDSIVTAHLFVLHRLILECEQTWDFYFENERHFAYTHIDPFIKGVPIDFERLSSLRQDDAAASAAAEARLREVLSERCQEVNEQGFETLWPEILSFKAADAGARAQKKGEVVDKDALEARLYALKREVHDACRYTPWSSPDNLTPQLLSVATRAVGLAPYRYKSLSEKKVNDWCDSMDLQNEAMEGDYTDEQRELLLALREAAPTLEACASENPADDAYKRLLFLCQDFWERDRASVYTGTELNVGSPQQMAYLFYGMLGLPILSRNIAKEGSTRNLFELEGAPATNELAMATWLVELPMGDWRREVIELVMTLRTCRQRESLYYKPYPLWAHPEDGRIRPGFRNCGTVTRRPSGSSPNFLQISKVKDQGRIRSCILPQNDDHVIVSIDFTQQELAILAGLSKDPTLLSCYVGDAKRDVHTTTTATIANILEPRRGGVPHWTYEECVAALKDPNHPDRDWLKEVRSRRAKVSNFLLSYAGSPMGLATKLIVDKELGKQIHEGFHNTYPGVNKRAEAVVNFGVNHGFVKTAFGNRRHVPGLLSPNKSVAKALARQSVNMEMQGTAADVAKIVCREYNRQRVAEKTGSVFLALVYDECACSVPKASLKQYIDMMQDIMQVAIPGTDITLAIDVSIGANWGKQIELNGDHSQKNIDNILSEIENQRTS